jgi:hypothetical protein
MERIVPSACSIPPAAESDKTTRDGQAAVVKPTVAQCAQLCRVPPAVLRDRRRSSRKPSLATVWVRATADEQTAFLRAQLDALLIATK